MVNFYYDSKLRVIREAGVVVLRQRTVALIVLCLCVTGVIAQDTTSEVEFSIPKYKPKKSLYKDIDFLDSRKDTSCIGVVGDEGKAKKLVLKTPVKPQLEFILQAYTNEDAGNGRLLLQLKRYSFAERSQAKYCYFNAVLYARDADRYVKLLAVDTTVFIGETEGRTKRALTKEVGRVLEELIAAALPLKATDTVSYSIDDLANLDNIEKRRIPLYNTSSYTEGFYSDYAAFMRQQPDLRGEVRTGKDGRISSLKIHDPRFTRWETKTHIYAVVYKGLPYIVTHFGYWPLQKSGDEFYFNGKLRILPTDLQRGMMGAAGVAGGALGGALASATTNDSRNYRVLIDHGNGEFIHLEVLEKL